MDLRTEAQRLVLDKLAVDISAELVRAGIPHALLKGPSTALWLYDPPRPYRDVDLLVPVSSLPRVVAALESAGLAHPGAGRVGEEAPHSLLLKSTAGSEIDVHISLPTVPVRGDDGVWDVLSEHVAPLDLDVGSVPALDEPGRCLVIALHALNSGPHAAQPGEDLTRARAQAAPKSWAAARRLAERLEVTDLLDGALTMTDADDFPGGRAGLYVMQAPSAAFGLDRLMRARRRDLPRLVWRELFPTSGFMHYDDPALPAGRLALLRAHWKRWRRLLRQLPAAVRAVISVRR